MVSGEGSDQRILDVIMAKTRSIAESLRGLRDEELHQPSQLPEWSRLTVACHLRFGAEALTRMTRAALQGLPVAYYLEGREVQRPHTLVPLPGESPHEVVESLTLLSERLNQEWSAVGSRSLGCRRRRARGES